MHPLDIVFLVVALFFFGLGLWRGIISEIFKILGLVAGFTAAVLFHGRLATQLSFMPIPENIRVGLAFALIFVVVLTLILLIGWGVRKAVQLATLGWADRLIGGLLGIMKAIILAWLFYAVLSFIPAHKIHASVDSSRLFKFFHSCPVPVPQLGITTKPLERVLDPKLLKSLKDAGKTIDDFGRKVDSVKSKR